jgi:UDP-glucuronate 4-epimerase
MKVLITGTAGFIGFHLANKLLEEGYQVLGIDVINDYYDIKLKYDRLAKSGFPKESIVYGESILCLSNPLSGFAQVALEDKEALFRIIESFQPEIIINLAAQAGVRYSLTNPDAYIDANIVGFLNILEASRKFHVKHLLYASSSSVYGLNKNMPFTTHKNVNHPVSLYAASKKSNELMAHAYSHLFGIPTTGLRFFTVYGPWGRPDMALFIFTKAVLNGEPIHVFNHGKMERDFTYIDDIVNGISKMIQNPPKGNPEWNPENPDPASSSAPYKIYNIGNSKPVKLLDFISEIENMTGKKAILDLMPIQPGDVEKTWADVDDLMTDFNYRPDTSIEKGIREFVLWFRDYYAY